MSEAGPRERMIRSAALLMRERGVEATSFSDVLAHSGAPRGSIYHHFPGGKAQLIAEATRWAGDVVEEGQHRALQGGDPVAALDARIASWRRRLTHTDFAAGCVAAAATLDGDGLPGVRAAAADAFRRWEAPYADVLQRSGVPVERARSLATLTIAALEGAILLARAQRSLEPLDRVAAEMRETLQAALAAIPTR